MVLADLAGHDFVDAALRVAAVGAAGAFYGTLIGGVVEAVRSIRHDRPARWGEPTVYGALLGGLAATAAEAFSLAFDGWQ